MHRHYPIDSIIILRVSCQDGRLCPVKMFFSIWYWHNPIYYDDDEVRKVRLSELSNLYTSNFQFFRMKRDSTLPSILFIIRFLRSSFLNAKIARRKLLRWQERWCSWEWYKYDLRVGAQVLLFSPAMKTWTDIQRVRRYNNDQVWIQGVEGWKLPSKMKAKIYLPKTFQKKCFRRLANYS